MMNERCKSYMSECGPQCLLCPGHRGTHVGVDDSGNSHHWSADGWAEVFKEFHAKLLGETVRGRILDEAKELTHGDRDKNYGTPQKNHERIAALWSTYLGHDITPEQVAVCMALVKIARLAQTPGLHDSYVDGAAYLAIAAEVSHGDV